MLLLSRQDDEVCGTKLVVRKGCKSVVGIRGGGGAPGAFELLFDVKCWGETVIAELAVREGQSHSYTK